MGDVVILAKHRKRERYWVLHDIFEAIPAYLRREAIIAAADPNAGVIDKQEMDIYLWVFECEEPV